MAKVVCVLYDDPVDGHPKAYPRDGIPKLEHYPGGQTMPTPKAIDFKPGELLGSVSGALGLRRWRLFNSLDVTCLGGVHTNPIAFVHERRHVYH